MNPSKDMQPFILAWSTCSEIQAGTKPSDTVLKATFQLLIDLDLDEITQAITSHCKRSHWMPRPAEIRKIVCGEVPETRILLELAYSNNTILGKYVRSLVNTDLNVLHPKQAESRVASCGIKIRDFYERALVGDYTEAELRMLIIAEIDLCSPIAPGCPSVRKPYRPALRTRILGVEIPKQIEEVVTARSEEESAEGKARLADIMRTLRMPQ